MLKKKTEYWQSIAFFWLHTFKKEEGPNSYGLVIMGIGGRGMRGACAAPLSMEHNKLEVSAGYTHHLSSRTRHQNKISAKFDLSKLTDRWCSNKLRDNNLGQKLVCRLFQMYLLDLGSHF